MAALARLSAEEQIVLRLRFVQQLPWDEVAAALSRSIDATKKFYQRAIRKWAQACMED
jgi:DNA-directed RNA polymerase specialized sigma24 family protein